MRFFYAPSRFVSPLSLIIFVFIIQQSIFGAVVRDGALDTSFIANPIASSGGGIVRDLEQQTDGKTVVAGSFTVISGATRPALARLLPNGQPDPTFNTGTGPNNQVKHVYLLPDGKMYISGDFTQYNGVTRNRIARINSDGSMDTGFAPDFGTMAVDIVAVQPDGKVIVNGPFTSIGGVSRNRLARLNYDGSLDTAFTVGAGFAFGSFANKGVIQPDGKIILTGKMTAYDGVPAASIVRLNTDGSKDSSFNSDLTGASTNELFDVYLTASGKIYICGDYWGGSVRRLNSDGTTDTTFNTTIVTGGNQRVWSVIELPDGKVLAGGEFDSFRIDGVLTIRYKIFRFNVDGSADTSFSIQAGASGSGGGVYALKRQPDGKILLGGDFPLLNGNRSAGLARIDGNSADGSFNAFIGRFATPNVVKIAPDGKIYLGGNFDGLASGGRPNLVRLNSDGTVDTAFNTDPLMNRSITSIALLPDGKVLLGGVTGDSFDGVGRGLWRLNSDGSIDSTFNAQVSTLSTVRVVVPLSDGKILVGGSFTTINSINRRMLARLNSDGSVDTTFDANLSALNVHDIAVDSAGDIYIGGDFSHVNGSPSSNIARLNSDGSLDTDFNIGVGANRTVYSIYIDTLGAIYFAGSFSNYRGVSTGSITKVKSDGTVDPEFKRVPISGDTSSIVPQPNGKLLISGSSDSNMDASIRRKIYRILKTGDIDFSFDAGAITQNGSSSSAIVSRLAVRPDGDILAVGNFNAINGQLSSGFARLKNNQRIPPPIFDYEGDGKSDITIFRPSGGLWYRVNTYQDQVRAYQFGLPEDKPVPADFDGDHLTDIAVYRPSNGSWYIRKSSNGSLSILNFGIAEDIPVAADFDGDGSADYALFRPSNGAWYILQSQADLRIVQFGLSGDKPVVADFDGDSRADIAIFRPAIGAWYAIRSSDNSIFATQFGLNGDIPVPGDYDGDFVSDVAVFRPSTGMWYLQTGQGLQVFQFGLDGDVPAPADHDGDGKMDIVVYRSGAWYILLSSGGFRVVNFGLAGDIPQTSRP